MLYRPIPTRPFRTNVSLLYRARYGSLAALSP